MKVIILAVSLIFTAQLSWAAGVIDAQCEGQRIALRTQVETPELILSQSVTPTGPTTQSLYAMLTVRMGKAYVKVYGGSCYQSEGCQPDLEVWLAREQSHPSFIIVKDNKGAVVRSEQVQCKHQIN